MQIVINDKNLEDKLIEKSKELKIKVSELIEKLLNDKLKEDNDTLAGSLNKYIDKNSDIDFKAIKEESWEKAMSEKYHIN